MDNVTYLLELGVDDPEVQKRCLEAMEKYQDNRWWEPDVDERTYAYYQFKEALLLSTFDRFHGAMEALVGRPVWTHEFATSQEQLRTEVEHAYREGTPELTAEQRQRSIVASMQSINELAEKNGKKILSIHTDDTIEDITSSIVRVLKDQSPKVIVFPADSTPEEKIRLVDMYVKAHGYDDPLVRIFNDALLPVVLEHGNDRATIAERNLIHSHYNPEKSFGYKKLLKKKGLSSADGLFAFPHSKWAPTFTNGLFQEETLTIPAQHAALALYDRSKMADIFGDEYNNPGEYYHFLDDTKQEALLVVFAQEHDAEEVILERLSYEEKLAFVEEKLPCLTTMEEVKMLQQRFFELQQAFETEEQKRWLIRLYRRFTKRHRELLILDNWQYELAFLQKKQTTETPGMSTTFILENLQKEIKQNTPRRFKTEIARLVESVRQLEQDFSK